MVLSFHHDLITTRRYKCCCQSRYEQKFKKLFSNHIFKFWILSPEVFLFEELFIQMIKILYWK